MGSRGSVIPFFQSLAHTGKLPITDPRMTRFMISLEQGVQLVWHAFEDMVGGEIYVKKIPSMKISDWTAQDLNCLMSDVIERIFRKRIGEYKNYKLLE
jgi:FlaA1/EpsC-like NDP-sugar epimerase